MEALRFVNLEAQQKKWVEVYCGLGPNVARDYDGLIDSNKQNHIQINFDPRQQYGKKEKKIHGVLGMHSFLLCTCSFLSVYSLYLEMLFVSCHITTHCI